MLAKFTKSKKTSIRLFAVDVCVSLLIQTVASDDASIRSSPGGFVNGSELLLAAVSARMEDKTPKLRARAMKGLGDVLRTGNAKV